jgi:uncharacterized membrane protein
LTASFFALLDGTKDRLLKLFNVERIEEFLNSKWRKFEISALLIFGMVTVYTLVFSYFTILKYNAFKAYAWDLGIYNQSLWTALQGRLFYSTVETFIVPSGSLLGIHFSLFLFPILPIYAIHPAPETLLILQSLVLALGTLPLYMLVRDTLHNKLSAIVFAFVYLMYVPLQGVNWFDFHLQAFLPIFFFSAIYCLTKEKWLSYFFFTVLAMTLADNVAITVVLMGLYCAWRFRRELHSAVFKKNLREIKIFIPFVTIGLGISWYLAAVWIKSALFPVNPSFYQIYLDTRSWSVLGINNSPITIPISIILNPSKAFEALSYDLYLKVFFLILIFGPLIFRSLRSSIVLVSLAWLGPALLSNNQAYYLIGNQYPAYVIPFVFAAAVFSFENSPRLLQNPKFIEYLKAILIAAVIFALFLSPLSPLLISPGNQAPPYFSDYTIPTLGPHEILLQKIANLVPPNASVLTQNNIFPHFSSRSNAYVYPLVWMIQSSSGTEFQNYTEGLFQKSQYVMVDTLSDPSTSSLILSRIQSGKDYGLYAQADGIYLYLKGYTGNATTLQP